MSVKMMGLVWDSELKRDHKFVLLAYADHADHDGNNIYPAVSTIMKKTGYSERSVQRITAELVAEGYLVDDGQGPHGTNKWCLGVPILRGAKVAGVQKTTKKGRKGGAKNDAEIAPEVKSFNRPLKDQPSLVAPNGAAPAEPPAKPTSEKIPISNELRKFAQDVFEEVTGLEPLPETTKANKGANNTRWWGPLRTICQVGKADRVVIRALIEGAVKDLTPEYISAPSSILNTIPKIKARLNGHKPAANHDPAAYEAERARKQAEARAALRGGA